MVLNFSLELKKVDVNAMNLEVRLERKQEGEARIIYNIKSFLQA